MKQAIRSETDMSDHGSPFISLPGCANKNNPTQLHYIHCLSLPHICSDFPSKLLCLVRLLFIQQEQDGQGINVNSSTLKLLK